jgi:hypothetical protein
MASDELIRDALEEALKRHPEAEKAIQFLSVVLAPPAVVTQEDLDWAISVLARYPDDGGLSEPKMAFEDTSDLSRVVRKHFGVDDNLLDNTQRVS